MTTNRTKTPSLLISKTFTLDELKSFKTDALRIICREFGVTKFNRSGVDKPIALSYARKDEMVSALAEYAVSSQEDIIVETVEPEPTKYERLEAPNLVVYLKQVVLPEFDRSVLAGIRRGLPSESVCKSCAALMFNIYSSVTSWRGRKGATLCGETIKSYMGTIFAGLTKHVESVVTDSTIQQTVLSDLGYYKSIYIRPIVQENLRVQSERLADRRKNVTEVAVAPIYEWAFDVIDKADVLLTQEGKRLWSDLSLALMLVTGRRTAEVGCTGEFTKSNEQGMLMFKGQLKCKTTDRTEEAYAIPVLYDVDKVLHAFEVLEKVGRKFTPRLYSHIPRDVLVKKTHNSFVTAYNTLSRKLTKRFFPNAQRVVTCQAYRQIYGQVCAALYKPSYMTKQAYISSILGHLPTDVTSGQNYDADYSVLDAESVKELLERSLSVSVSVA